MEYEITNEMDVQFFGLMLLPGIGARAYRVQLSINNR